ncbi:MAG: hypothetical protein ACOC23_09355, partial [Thermodesulfobacteriota bacterium]
PRRRPSSATSGSFSSLTEEPGTGTPTVVVSGGGDGSDCFIGAAESASPRGEPEGAVCYLFSC